MKVTFWSAIAAITSAVAAEEIHFVNCGYNSLYQYSHVWYYADAPNGQLPDDKDMCSPNGYDLFTWEGKEFTCKFPTGVTVSSKIDADAQKYSDYAWAGWLWNGKSWECYKDDKHLLYANDPLIGLECDSIYYCLPN